MSLQTPEITGSEFTLSYSTDGITYHAFAKIEDATSFKISVPEIDITTLNSTAKKKQPGTPDYGDWSLSVLYSEALTTLVMGWVAGKTELAFKIDINEATGSDTLCTFEGSVKDFDPFGGIKNGEKTVSKITFMISGAVDYSAGS